MPDGIDAISGNRPAPEVDHNRQIREDELRRELEEADRERERYQDEAKGQSIDTYA